MHIMPNIPTLYTNPKLILLNMLLNLPNILLLIKLNPPISLPPMFDNNPPLSNMLKLPNLWFMPTFLLLSPTAMSTTMS